MVRITGFYCRISVLPWPTFVGGLALQERSRTIADKIIDMSNPRKSDGMVISGLSHTLNGQPFYQKLSLTLTEKRIGLIGRNGSGKSTLSRMICGLTEPDEGEILIHGVNVFKDRKEAIRTIGLIFQNPDHQIIFPTVEEEIAFGLESLLGNKKAAREKARAFLKAFGREDWSERGTYTLSQGQRHLVCLMAVLAMEPKAILLDEPFAGLDWPTSRRLFNWLSSLEQQLVLVTHDTNHLKDFDRILWLEKGQLVADGHPSDILPAYHEAMEALVNDEDPFASGETELELGTMPAMAAAAGEGA